MMNDLNVISGQESIKGKKVRYIEFDNINYFIYTLNEKDDEGYEKLYINKIIGNEEDVITDSEWDELKSNIPTIVKEIKNNNISSFKDLSLDDIKRGNLNYAKAFKLKINIVDAITKEEKEEKLDVHSEINNLIKELHQQERSINPLDSFLDNIGSSVEKPINPSNRKEEELEQALEKEKEKKKKLKNMIVRLKKENIYYKKKLQQIKIMIEKS